MKLLQQASLLIALALGSVPVLAADATRVQVRFAGDLSAYADLGESDDDRAANVAALTSIFQGLSSLLPAGQSLDIVVSDVNLAGELEWLRSAQRLRVMRNVGWPMVQLSYTLKAGDQVLRQGEQRVTDMAYLSSRPMGIESQRLAYEERMLEHWLKGLLNPR